MLTDPKVVFQFGGTSVPLGFSELKCTGTEKNLLDCDHGESGNCFLIEVIGVSCGKLHPYARYYMKIIQHSNYLPFSSAPPCIEGQVRLLADRVQICREKVWGYACRDSKWSLENARVVCRELGFSTQGCYHNILCILLVLLQWLMCACIYIQKWETLLYFTLSNKSVFLTSLINQIATVLKSTLLTAHRVGIIVFEPVQLLSIVQVFILVIKILRSVWELVEPL